MTEVTSISELKAALERGETEFYTTNKKLLYASALVSKLQRKRSRSWGAANLKKKGKSLPIVALAVVFSATIIALYSIYKDRIVEVDIKKGIIKVKNKAK